MSSASIDELPDQPTTGSPELYTKTSKRVLEPVERISEVLFGLIIVLSFTCSFGFQRVEQDEVHTMLLQVVGCSLAWGIIDAAFYLLGCLTERGHNLLVLRQVRKTADPEEARQAIADLIPPLLASRLHDSAYESLREELQRLPEPPSHPWILRSDFPAAATVFFLAFGSIFPVIVPFTFMSNARHALRVSNLIAVVMLFLAGYALGRYASNRPWRIGILMVVVGAAMVGVAIALGG